MNIRESLIDIRAIRESPLQILQSNYNSHRRSLSLTRRKADITFVEDKNITLRSNISHAVGHISLNKRNTPKQGVPFVFYLLFAVFTIPK